MKAPNKHTQFIINMILLISGEEMRYSINIFEKVE